MPNTTKNDHKDRAIAIIATFISTPENTEGWSVDDTKTSWLSRANKVGVAGYSAQLRDMFIETKMRAAV